MSEESNTFERVLVNEIHNDADLCVSLWMYVSSVYTPLIEYSSDNETRVMLAKNYVSSFFNFSGYQSIDEESAIKFKIFLLRDKLEQLRKDVTRSAIVDEREMLIVLLCTKLLDEGYGLTADCMKYLNKIYSKY